MRMTSSQIRDTRGLAILIDQLEDAAVVAGEDAHRVVEENPSATNMFAECLNEDAQRAISGVVAHLTRERLFAGLAQRYRDAMREHCGQGGRR